MKTQNIKTQKNDEEKLSKKQLTRNNLVDNTDNQKINDVYQTVISEIEEKPFNYYQENPKNNQKNHMSHSTQDSSERKASYNLRKKNFNINENDNLSPNLQQNIKQSQFSSNDKYNEQEIICFTPCVEKQELNSNSFFENFDNIIQIKINKDNLRLSSNLQNGYLKTNYQNSLNYATINYQCKQANPNVYKSLLTQFDQVRGESSPELKEQNKEKQLFQYVNTVEQRQSMKFQKTQPNNGLQKQSSSITLGQQNKYFNCINNVMNKNSALATINNVFIYSSLGQNQNIINNSSSIINNDSNLSINNNQQNNNVNQIQQIDNCKKIFKINSGSNILVNNSTNFNKDSNTTYNFNQENKENNCTGIQNNSKYIDNSKKQEYTSLDARKTILEIKPQIQSTNQNYDNFTGEEIERIEGKNTSISSNNFADCKNNFAQNTSEFLTSKINGLYGLKQAQNILTSRNNNSQFTENTNFSKPSSLQPFFFYEKDLVGYNNNLKKGKIYDRNSIIQNMDDNSLIGNNGSQSIINLNVSKNNSNYYTNATVSNISSTSNAINKNIKKNITEFNQGNIQTFFSQRQQNFKINNKSSRNNQFFKDDVKYKFSKEGNRVLSQNNIINSQFGNPNSLNRHTYIHKNQQQSSIFK